ncbi:alpha/beta hydrolase family protein [Aliidiomarina minuta]|nr:prolyl oligopeptidase family serine peptidase [Aliidiomarina minuta]
MQRVITLSAICLALASFSSSAIDPDDIWVNEVAPGSGSLKAFDSDHAEVLQQSLIKRWLQEEVSGEVLSQWSTDSEPGTQMLHVPVGVDRFTQGKLQLDNIEQASVFINGQRVNASGEDYELQLQTGDHQLLVLVEDAEDWSSIGLTWQGEAEHDVLHTARPDNYRLNAEQLFDAQTTTELSLSPDGDYMIWRRQHFSAETGDTPQFRLQLMHTESEQAVFEWTDTSASGFAWQQNSEQLAYISDNKVHILSLADMQIEAVTPELSGISNVRWIDDEQLIFSWNKTPDNDAGLTKRYQALEDRWSYFRDNSQLYTLNLANSAMHQLTQNPVSTSLQDIDAQGEYVLASRRQVDYAEPPHFAVELLEIRISDGAERVIGEYRTFNQALYGAEGIYVVAGPEFAEGAGRNVPEDMLSNNYDGQLYWMNRQGEDVGPLAIDFDPAIGAIYSAGENNLLLRVTERDGTQLYHYQADNQRFNKLNNNLDVIDQVAVSQQDSPRVAFAGTAARAPQRLYTQSLDSAQPSLWWDSKDDYYRLNSLSSVREWNFNNERGDTIYGRIYLPHDFDENESYPALVYYYGGTTPVQRAFTGRYPFNLWADMGYVVYVLQPTGATGFGQEFSARHVNAWGEYTVDDILQGTERFIEQHEFVDADRVGNLGASYGGFMTMLLATKTDLFAASMSHAGISSITSYWGQGWWGFLYSGEASKGSFPWNNPELYRDQSPVYRADRVNTPMLLIHGDADTNVPPGESHNMYTALKLLDKEVELVEYLGENHAINNREARLHWWQTYMAFFDKHLKDEPQWWQSLYPEN